MREPIQHPVTKLGFFVDYTTSWLADVREAAATLEQARPKPHVLTDGDVARARKVYSQQAEDLVLFEDTATRWAGQNDLTSGQRDGLARFKENLTALRELNTSVLELITYLEPRTIDRVLATPDVELGLNALLSQSKGNRPEG